MSRWAKDTYKTKKLLAWLLGVGAASAMAPQSANRVRSKAPIVEDGF
jgi:hypothetical protein